RAPGVRGRTAEEKKRLEAPGYATRSRLREALHGPRAPGRARLRLRLPAQGLGIGLRVAVADAETAVAQDGDLGADPAAARLGLLAAQLDQVLGRALEVAGLERLGRRGVLLAREDVANAAGFVVGL